MAICVKDSVMGLLYIDWILGEVKILCLYKMCEKMTFEFRYFWAITGGRWKFHSATL